MKIPFDKINEFKIKYNHFNFEDKKLEKEYYKELDEQFEIMKHVNKQEIESLTKEELKQLPISWIYDWQHLNGGFDDSCEILELYKKHNLEEYTKERFILKPRKRQYNYEDINKILPNSQLRFYIEKLLVDNKEFINDIDDCMWECSGKNKLINKTTRKRMEYFDNNIGNTARTYIFKVLTLKHLSKILLNNIDTYTDEFWRDRLNKVLYKDDLHKEYDKQLEKMLSNKFPYKTTEEISQMPIETILENKTNNEFELSKNNITEIITKKHNENKQNKQQEQTDTYNKPTNEEKLQKINELVSQDKISISTLQRLFYISFPKAVLIINNLVENKAIERLEKGYKIIDKDKLKDELVNI